MAEHAVILLAEDDEDYVFVIKEAFSKADIRNPLFVVSDGKEAMLYFQGEGKFANREEYPLPDLLLLDLKLPKFSGFEVLAWVRSQPGLAGLRILVLTSSERMKDVNDAYRLGANSFLMKPYDFSDLVQLGRLIQEYWLEKSKCPQSFRSQQNNRDTEEAEDKNGKHG
jgi:CheY-like chemotaxis protein